MKWAMGPSELARVKPDWRTAMLDEPCCEDERLAQNGKPGEAKATHIAVT